MKRILTAALLLSAFSTAAVAAEPVITETDTEIIVEYNGSADEKPASPGAAAVQEPAPPGAGAAEVPAAAASAGGTPNASESDERAKRREELRKARESRRSSRLPGQGADEGAGEAW